MEEEEQEFQIIWSQTGTSKVEESTDSVYSREVQACREIQESLVEDSLRSTIDDIAGQCHDEYSNGIHSQIFTLEFRKNQEDQFRSFSAQLQAKFREERGIIFGLDEESVEVVVLQRAEVREIVLHMYVYLQEHPESALVVFIIGAISDLDERNLYCFEKGLKGKSFVAILPTFSSFESKHETALVNFEKYHYKLYNSRDLFCKYLFHCLASPAVKPYLSPQVLSLISDIDYYSISFRQSCRRFAYCLQRALMLVPRQRSFVQFSELVLLVDAAIADRFTYYPGMKNAHEKMLKVILDEKEIYTVSEKAIGYEIAFSSGVQGREAVEETDIIREIRESLRRQLRRDGRFAGYAEYLVEREESREAVLRRRRSRADQLGIDTKKNITPKNTLENQITRIIKEATASIRQQAAFIDWHDIKFELRIKPQLPFLIKEAWANDPETSELLEEVGGNYSAPLSSFLGKFEGEEAGRGVYLLRCLQLAGLIDVNKRHLRPAVFATFFQKAKFTGKQPQPS